MDSPAKKEILRHLPYAIEHVAGGLWACRLIASTKRHMPLQILIGGSSRAGFPNFRPLTNPLAETGIIYCRKLIEFLGIKLSAKGDSLIAIKKRRNDDDAGIEQLDLDRPTVEDLLLLGVADRDATESAVVHTLRAANKGVAHFTNTPFNRADLRKLILCSETTLAGMEAFVWRPLGRSFPTCNPWCPKA